ncbi:isoprenylcysteine carboxyl methyltransferase family protein [Jiella endophytica]|uniref:isoprenylcysteine carboxyl methyltransferase family protein n=1 Tax=Jiella endophytica TaxID=2558362 RepID=UPI001FE1BD8E|nr:isoprenylcysteine carboxylmethyltransferase family protein [Jiella endophytica]
MTGDAAFPIGFAILAYVTGQRLVELLLARRNTQRLIAEGAFEVASGHYGLIVLVHAAWLIALWLYAQGRPILVVPLVLFAIVQLARFWVLASIGRRWTTRIIVKPGETLVARGPYRWFAHPNYLVVVCEIFLLPAVFGLWEIAILFSLLNAGILMIRIPAEASALRRHRG